MSEEFQSYARDVAISADPNAIPREFAPVGGIEAAFLSYCAAAGRRTGRLAFVRRRDTISATKSGANRKPDAGV